MKEKFVGVIVLTIVIIIGLSSIYLIQETIYGKSIEGTKGFLEASKHREMAEKAINLKIDNSAELTKIINMIKKRQKVCASMVNTRTHTIQQEIVKSTYQIQNIEKMTETRSVKFGPTWKIFDVDKAPCKSVEEILK